jgi:membrane protein YqaA with SNARE-associated domain
MNRYLFGSLGSLARIQDQPVSLALRLGGPGMVALGIAHSFVPMPGGLDAVTILLSAHHGEWWWYYALMALSGDMIGGFLNYRLSRKGGKQALERKLSPARAEKLYRRFERWGMGALLVGAWMPPPTPWLPFLSTAGALQYPPQKFLAAIALGRGTRFLALAYVGRRYGGWIVGVLAQYQRPILYGLLGLAAAGGTALIAYFLWYRKRSGTQTAGQGKAPVPISGGQNRASDAAQLPRRRRAR